MGRCSPKRSRALHMTSFSSKEPDNRDGRYDLPTLDRLEGLSLGFEHWMPKRKVYFPLLTLSKIITKGRQR
jgi:hypothetical protein